MHHKIGFLAGVKGNPTGIGNYVKACNDAGVPAIVASNDAPVGIGDVLALEQQNADHQMLYRVVRQGDEKYAVPNYSASPQNAAKEYYDLVEPEIPPEIKQDKDKIWIAVGNELDKNRSEWLADWGIESAKIWGTNGYKIALFGWSSGEPEISHWRGPRMLEFLKLAGENREKIAVNLHEYSYNDNLYDIYPWKIGRFQFLFGVCDENDIPRPTVWIGEWGWHQDTAPPVENGIGPLVDVANMYAQFKTIRGAAFWTLHGWHSDIYNTVNNYIAPVTASSVLYEFKDFSRTLIIPPDYDEEPPQPPFPDMHVDMCDVSRHNNKKDSQGNPAEPIDFEQMREKGIHHVYIRASIGRTGLDDAFEMNLKAANEAGMNYGLYHLVNTYYTAQENLNNIIRVVDKYGHGDKIIALDVEPLKNSSDQYIPIRGERVTQLIELFKQKYGYEPLVYTGMWVKSHVVNDVSWFNTSLLWLAEYWDHPPAVGEYPRIPPGNNLGSLLAHQWTSTYYNGKEYGVASHGLDFNVVYAINTLDWNGDAPPPEKYTSVVVLLPQEADEDYWSELARHAFRDHKRDMTASHNTAETVYLSGNDKSYIKVLDPEYPSNERALKYFQSMGYRVEIVPFRPPKDEPQPPEPPGPPPTGKVNVASFMVADPRAWRVVRHPNNQQEDIQDMILSNGMFVRRKNNLGEWWVRGSEYMYLLHDTSPAPDSHGNERVYTLSVGNRVGAAKNPVNMSVGQQWVDQNLHQVRFRSKKDCSFLPENSGYARNTCVFTRYEKNYTFNTYGQNLTLDEVIWLKTGTETQIYAKHGGSAVGWVGWEAPWGKSEIVELHWNRPRMTEEPNRFCQF